MYCVSLWSFRIVLSTTEREVTNDQVDGYIFVDWGQQFRAEHSRSYPEVPFHRYEVGVADVALNHILKEGGSGYFSKELVKKHIDNRSLYPVVNAPSLSLDIFWVCNQGRLSEEHLVQAITGLKEILS